MIHSMTGFSSRSFTFKDETYKVEIKTLNHRFLDLKLRIPRDLNSFEPIFKPLVEKELKRGSVELWVEKLSQRNEKTESIRINDEQAQTAHTLLTKLAHRFSLSEGVSLRDLITFPDVIEKTTGVVLTSEETLEFESLLKLEVTKGLQELNRMRLVEGGKLSQALLEIIAQFKKAHQNFLQMRTVIQSRAKEKIKKRVEQCFEAYSTSDEKLRALMETRIAQEVSYTLEKLDIEEELTRFKGHVDQIEILLTQGGMVGKKLDFMFQELNREINTLGNKSQDLGVSQEVIGLKMWIEQMREQSLNLE